MEETKQKQLKLIKNIIIFGLGNFSVKFVQFILMPILTNYLSIIDYGINEILCNIIDLSIPILTLGIAESLFRFSIDDNFTLEDVFSNGILSIIFCAVIVTIVVPIVYYFQHKLYILLMLPLLILTAFKKLIAEFTRGRGKTVLYSLGGVIGALCSLIFSCIFLIHFRLGILGYIFATLLSNIVVIIFYFILCNPFKYFKLHNFNKNKLKKMIKFAFPNVINMFSWWLVQTSSKYILIFFCGLSISSLYMASAKIPALINLISTIFQQAWSLSSSEECKNKNKDYFYSSTFKYYSFLVIFAVSVVISLSPIISKILLQGEFYSSWRYSPILILSSGLGCFSSFFGAFYSAFYDTKTAMYTTLIGGVFNLLISVILIPFIGVYGAIIGNILSYLTIVVSRIYTTKKYVNIKTNWNKIIIFFFLLLIQGIIFTFCKNAIILIFISLLLIFFIMFSFKNELHNIGQQIHHLLHHLKLK